MAKQKHQETKAAGPGGALAILTIGGILVAGLVVWALTRTVESPAATPADTQPVASTTFDTSSTAASPITTTNPPISTLTAPATLPPAVPVEGERNDVARIAAEDLRAKYDRGEVTVVDVRTAADYASGHIPGALNIPFASVESMVDMIPKGKAVVTYCT